jgi:hypothetical protein
LRALWDTSHGFRADATNRLSAIDKAIANIRRALEEGLNDAAWANARLDQLLAERATLIPAAVKGSPPQLDAEVVMEYRRQAGKLFKEGTQAERKRLLRTWVKEVVLKPEDLTIEISYRLPETVMNGLVAGVDLNHRPLGYEFNTSLVSSGCSEISTT